MLNVSTTTKFENESERARKRGKDMSKLGEIIKKLAKEESLDSKHRNHKLKGNFKGRWECHVEPDWLLVYYKTDSEIIFERTGTHSDLFKK
jgi:mRNA interferase YafQ